MSDLRSDLVLLGHYHFHTRVSDGIWYAGSTDTFSFADDPDKPKGIVLLDTGTGECRHLPLVGLRPLVTLESVYAFGLSPAELSDQVLERAARSPRVRSPASTWRASTPRPTGCSTVKPSAQAASAGLHLGLEPQFQAAAVPAELPSVETLGGQWDSWLSAPGPCRPGPRAGAWTWATATCKKPSSRPASADAAAWAEGDRVLIDRIYLRNYRVFEDELDLAPASGPGGRLRPQRGREVDACSSPSSGLCGARPARGKRKSPRQAPAANAWPRSPSSTRATSTSSAGRSRGPTPRSGQRPTVTGWPWPRACGTPAATSTRCWAWTTPPSGRRSSPSRSSSPPFPTRARPNAASSSWPCSGVTPLDAARDRARADARHITEAHNRLRGMLPDLEEAKVAAADAEARAGAAEAEAPRKRARPSRPSTRRSRSQRGLRPAGPGPPGAREAAPRGQSGPCHLRRFT